MLIYQSASRACQTQHFKPWLCLSTSKHILTLLDHLDTEGVEFVVFKELNDNE